MTKNACKQESRTSSNVCSGILTYFVEIEGELAGNGTIESSFQVRGPILVEDMLATGVFLADTRHSRINTFAAIYVLDGCFAEEEEHVLTDVVGSNEIWF